jgi:hypothetical protein
VAQFSDRDLKDMAAYIASLPGTMVVKKWLISLAKLAKKKKPLKAAFFIDKLTETRLLGSHLTL